jgi:hypothetical protein
MVNQSLAKRDKPRLLPNLRPEDDTPGLIAYRRGDSPAELDLGKGFDLLQADSQLKDIANSTQTFIIPTRRGQDGWIAKIWGELKEVKEVKTRLGELVFQLSENREKSFAKYNSYSYRNDMRQIDQENENLQRLEFLKMPSINELKRMSFPKIDAVEWKLENPPKDVLGANLGLLDPIRMDCQIYIRPYQSNSEKSWYLVCFGQNNQKRQRAIRKLIKLQENITAAEPPSMEFYLVKPVKFNEVKKEVILLDYEAPHVIERSHQIIPAQPTKLGLFAFGSECMDEEDWDMWDQTNQTEISDLGPGEINIVDYSNRLNAQYLELWFTQIMQNMPNYNGSLQMRASIGTCTFHSFPGKAYGNFHISFFRQLLKDRNTDLNQLSSKFADELGDREVEHRLYHRFFSSPQSLTYLHTHDFSDLHDRNPECTISFILQDPTTDNLKDNLKLQIEFPAPTSPGNIKWFRVPKRGHDVLSVNILDFQNVNSSYQLSVRRTLELKEKEIESLPKVYQQFAQGISLNPDFVKTFLNDSHSTARMYDEKSRHKVSLLGIEQRRTWSFQFQNTDYIVDLHLFMKIKVQNREVLTYNHTKSENRWSVEVRHKSWDEKFAQNHDLRIGTGARWKAEESEFFPSHESMDGEARRPGEVWVRGSGFCELFRIMDELVRLMRLPLPTSGNENCRIGEEYENELINGVKVLQV